MSNQTNIIRFRPVIERVGIQRSQIYRRIKAGLFPAPIRVAGRALGWAEAWIDGYNELIAAGASDEKIQEFVNSVRPVLLERPRRIRAK